VAIVQCGQNYMVRVGPRGSFIIEPVPVVVRDLEDEEELVAQYKRKRKPSASDESPAGKRQQGPGGNDRPEGGQGGQGISV